MPPDTPYGFSPGLALRLVAPCLFWAAAASAQIAPPVVQGDTAVPYPPGGQGDAIVLLELVVAEDGSVSHAEVIEGQEPFAEQARAAVLAWRFEPARRGDTAVAARIRAQVAFRQQPVPPPAEAVAQPSAAAPPETPLEVTVRGRRREIGQTSLASGELRVLPGAFGDPFRAIDALPGVTPLVSGFPYFFVRGSPPNDNAYYVDGIRVPLLFHVGLAQGVIHPGLIDRLDFLPAAPPVSYAGSLGAVVAAQTRDPSPKLRGEANLRLVDAGVLLETPFANGRGSALVAGRYGFPGPLLRAITSDIDLSFWDYQTRASWHFTQRDSLRLLAFGSHDYLATGTPLVEQFVSDFHRVDLRYEHASADGYVRVALTLGYDSRGAQPSYLTDLSAGLRVDLDQPLSSALRIRAGAAASFDDYGFVKKKPDPDKAVMPASADPPPRNLVAGLYADAVLRLGSRVELVPGLRADVYHSTRVDAEGDRTRTTVPALDPRLLARVVLAPPLASLTSVGLSHQYPSLRVGSVPSVLVTGSGFPPESSQLQAALQASQGFELTLPADLTLTATGFLSLWWGMTDLTADCIQVMPPTLPPSNADGPPPEMPYVCPGDQPVDGHAYGLELQLRRPLTKRLSGWISYTLSRSVRETHFVTLEGEVAVATVPSEADRTHVLSAILSYDFGGGWRAGGRFVFYTGSPYSLLAGNVPVPPYHDHRTPAFYRIDVRLEKSWALGDDASIALVLEGQNVTLRKEVVGLGLDCVGDFGPEGGSNRCTQPKVGPLTIPSVGVEAFF